MLHLVHAKYKILSLYGTKSIQLTKEQIVSAEFAYYFMKQLTELVLENMQVFLNFHNFK